jgi:hypothetical protein
MTAGPLSVAQLGFLAFAVARPKPFAWRWLTATGETSLSVHSHHRLIARKISGGAEIQCGVTTAELDALSPYWTAPLVTLNDAGLAALATRGTPLMTTRAPPTSRSQVFRDNLAYLLD